MEISSSTSAPAVTQATTVANEVQKKTEEVQEQNAQTLVQSVPDPDSSLGQNVDVTA
jgi:hypothetical protein